MEQQGYWLVVRTKIRREKWAGDNIEHQGFGVYNPLVAIELSLVQVKIESLFPGYLFVYTPNGQWRVLTGTFGVVGVVMYGGVPARISELEIDRVRAREDENGIVRLPSALQSERRPKFGDTIRVKDGPFEDREGICVGSRGLERTTVLMDFLGGKVPTLLRNDQLDIL